MGEVETGPSARPLLNSDISLFLLLPSNWPSLLLSTRGDIPPDRFFARAISLPSQLNSSPTVSIPAVQLLNSQSPSLVLPPLVLRVLSQRKPRCTRGDCAVILASAPCGVMSARPWNMKIFCHFRLYLHLKRRKRQIEATEGGRTRTWCRC